MPLNAQEKPGINLRVNPNKYLTGLYEFDGLRCPLRTFRSPLRTRCSPLRTCRLPLRTCRLPLHTCRSALCSVTHLSLVVAAARLRHLAHVDRQVVQRSDPAVLAHVGGDAYAGLRTGVVRGVRRRATLQLEPSHRDGGDHAGLQAGRGLQRSQDLGARVAAHPQPRALLPGANTADTRDGHKPEHCFRESILRTRETVT